MAGVLRPRAVERARDLRAPRRRRRGVRRDSSRSWASAGARVDLLVVCDGAKGSHRPVDASALAERRARELREPRPRCWARRSAEQPGHPRRRRGQRRGPRAALVARVRGSPPRWSSRRTRRPSSSTASTSTTATTARPAGRCSTPSRRPLRCRTTSRRPARPTRCRTCCSRGTLEADVVVDVDGAIDAKVAAVLSHRSQLGGDEAQVRRRSPSAPSAPAAWSASPTARPSATSPRRLTPTARRRRRILHVDLDAFFASVEVLDDPTLAGKPVIVGGDGARGVVASASYEARRYGVRSAMPSVEATPALPGPDHPAGPLRPLRGVLGTLPRPRRRPHPGLRAARPRRGLRGPARPAAPARGAGGRGARAARAHPRGALAALRVGLARNKLFAKLASREAKPRVEDGRLVEGPGVVWVSPETRRAGSTSSTSATSGGSGRRPRPNWGASGSPTCATCAASTRRRWPRHVGPALAATLSAYAVGEDRREVEPARVTKSIGHEETFAVSCLARPSRAPRARARARPVVARALRDHDAGRARS